MIADRPARQDQEVRHYDQQQPRDGAFPRLVRCQAQKCQAKIPEQHTAQTEVKRGVDGLARSASVNFIRQKPGMGGVDGLVAFEIISAKEIFEGVAADIGERASHAREMNSNHQREISEDDSPAFFAHVGVASRAIASKCI